MYFLIVNRNFYKIFKFNNKIKKIINNHLKNDKTNKYRIRNILSLKNMFKK